MLQKIRIQTIDGYAQLTLLKRHCLHQPDPYQLLIEAICHQAALDIKSKSYEIKTDAMDFFRSKWFKHLTDLDGEEIIQKLLKKEVKNDKAERGCSIRN